MIKDSRSLPRGVVTTGQESEEILVSLDLEMTSGRDDGEAIEIAAVKFLGERVLGSWTRLIKPSGSLPFSVQVLTGIHPEELTQAPSLAEVKDELVAFLGSHPLVAHTVSSDVNCLARGGVALDNPQIDTHELATVLLPRMEGYSLAALAEHFGIVFPNKHRATGDALATKALLLKLTEFASELDTAVLTEIERLLAPFHWPLRRVFLQAKAVRLKRQSEEIQFGASIRDQLIAKMGARGSSKAAPTSDGKGSDGLGSLVTRPPRLTPLLPAPVIQPLDCGEIARLFSPEGALSRTLEGFSYRPEQELLAEFVASSLTASLSRKSRAVVEVGTGVGRTLGYLLPALVWATQNGQSSVISTASVALFDQISERDAPAAFATLAETGWRDDGRRRGSISTARLKRRESYLCLSRYEAMRGRSDLTLPEAIVLAKILIWLPATDTGDIAELNLSDEERAFMRKITADGAHGPESCHYARRGECFHDRAIAAARSARLVVTTHDALLQATESNEFSGGAIGSHLIIDEGASLEREATAHWTFSLTRSDFERLLGDLFGPRGLLVDLGRLFPDLPAELAEATAGLVGQEESCRKLGHDVFSALSAFLQGASRDNLGYEQRAGVTRGARQTFPWRKVSERAVELSGAFSHLRESLREIREILLIATRARQIDCRPQLDSTARVVVALERWASELERAIGPDSASDTIVWTSLTADGVSGLHSAPLSVAPGLRLLYERYDSLLVTDNALAVDNRLDYARRTLGLNGEMDDVSGNGLENEAKSVTEGIIESPFDYENRALVYLPTDIPEPDAADYADKLQGALFGLIAALEGRTLVLFTNTSQLRLTWRSLQKRLADRGILALGMNVDGSPRRLLVSTFRNNPKSALFGTGYLWETVEVEGEALSALAITRLPFPRPADPIVAARTDGLKDPLGDYTLPETILRLKKGFGRLLRTPDDRGIAVLFDRRLQTKEYGELILRSLPTGARRQGTLAELPQAAREWLGRINVIG